MGIVPLEILFERVEQPLNGRTAHSEPVRMRFALGLQNGILDDVPRRLVLQALLTSADKLVTAEERQPVDTDD